MRLLAAALFLAGCATAPPPPPERLAGCWIDHGASAITTMRWLPDASRPGVLRGDLLEYRLSGQNRRARYTLEPRGADWVLCAQDGASAVCLQVAEGAEGSLEGGRAFIDAHGESLRISSLSGGDEDVIFDGRRDGCD